MARCKNDLLMKKIGVEKLNNLQEVDFTVLNELPDCRRINASKRLTAGGTYNRYRIPENQFECMRQGCVNSGTLFNEGADALYQAQFDATEFAAGVVTFYVTGADEGTVTFKIGDTDALTDADVYEIPLTDLAGGRDGYKAVVVDLASTPTSQEGAGWTPNATGAFISIAVAPAAGQPTTDIGISSIFIFDDIADFETTNTVKIGCLTTVGGAWELDAAEQTCFSTGGYDETTINNFEMTVTGKALTSNYMLLHPLMGKGSAVEGFDMDTIEKTVEAEGDFGVVVLADKDVLECGFLSVALGDSCNVADSALTALSVPSKMDIDEGHYIVEEQADGTTKVYFNKAHVGAPVVISYPKKVEVEEWEISEDNAGSRKVRLSYARTWTDGTKWRFVFDNVLVTSFPDEITEEESEFEFTIVIQKDATGRFGRAYRILG